MSLLDSKIMENNKILGMIKEAFILDAPIDPIVSLVTTPIKGLASGASNILGQVSGETVELLGRLGAVGSQGIADLIQNAPLITLGAGAGIGGLGALLASEFSGALEGERKQLKILKKYKKQQEKYKKLLEEASMQER